MDKKNAILLKLTGMSYVFLPDFLWEYELIQTVFPKTKRKRILKKFCKNRKNYERRLIYKWFLFDGKICIAEPLIVRFLDEDERLVLNS